MQIVGGIPHYFWDLCAGSVLVPINFSTGPGGPCGVVEEVTVRVGGTGLFAPVVHLVPASLAKVLNTSVVIRFTNGTVWKDHLFLWVDAPKKTLCCAQPFLTHYFIDERNA